MTTIQEARKGLESAKQKLREQKEQIRKKREEAKKVEEKVVEEKQKLPKLTQRLLRSGIFSGLEGRKRRVILGKAKKELIGKQKEIDLFKESLSKYEEEKLKPFELKLKKSEEEIRKAEEYNRAVEIIQKAALKDMVWAHAIYGEGIVKKLAKEYLKTKNLLEKKEREMMATPKLKDIGTYYTESKTFVDPSGWGYSMREAPKGAKIVKKYDPNLMLSNLFTSRDLSRTDILKDISPLKKLDLKKIDTNVKNLVDKPFLTTGSPKRFTPLLSSKPKLPPTPNKPRITPKKITRKGGYKKDSYIFGSKEEKKYLPFGFLPDKKKKKKSIWGW